MIKVKCLNCKKHNFKNNRHTCTENINIYVLGVLQEPMVQDCLEYDPIHFQQKKKPWELSMIETRSKWKL